MWHFDAREAAVAPAVWSTKSRPYLPWRLYQQVKHLWASWQNQISCHLASPDFMNAQMNVLWEKHSVWFCLIQIPLSEEDTMKGPGVASCQMVENSWQTDFRGRNQHILIRSRWLMHWPNMSCQTKKNQKVQQTLPPMNGKALQNCHWYLLYRSNGQKARYCHRARRAFLERIAPTFY